MDVLLVRSEAKWNHTRLAQAGRRVVVDIDLRVAELFEVNYEPDAGQTWRC